MRFITNYMEVTEEEAIGYLLIPRPYISVDIESVSLENKLPLGIAVGITSDIGYYFFNTYDTLVKQVIEQTPIVLFHNAAFDIPVLKGLGISVNRFEDTMLLAYAGGMLHKGLEELSDSLLHKPYTSVTSQWKKPKQGNIAIDHVKMGGWSIQHAINTLALWEVIPKTELYKSIDRPAIDLVMEMESHGLLIDQFMLTQVEQETMVKVQKLEVDLFAEFGKNEEGEDVNLASNPQVVEALQTKGIMGTRKTKAGKDSVSEESLKPLHNPIADKVLKWRSLMKTLSTYVPSFRSVDSQGKIHTSYGYTNTGRWNSSEPNLQNITRDEKFSEE